MRPSANPGSWRFFQMQPHKRTAHFHQALEAKSIPSENMRKTSPISARVLIEASLLNQRRRVRADDKSSHRYPSTMGWRRHSASPASPTPDPEQVPIRLYSPPPTQMKFYTTIRRTLKDCACTTSAVFIKAWRLCTNIRPTKRHDQ